MKRFLVTAGAGAFVIAMGACGSNDSTTQPTSIAFQVTAVDSALIAVHASADATVSDVNTLNGISATMGWSLGNMQQSGVSMSFTPSGTPAFSQGPGSGCTLNTADGRFDCPATVNGNGVTVVRSLAFFDINGVMMNHFDSTTASMNVLATENGIVITTLGADTVNGSRNVTASGLIGHNTTRTWNGTGTGTHGAFWLDSAASRTADVTYNSTLSNVVVALPRSTNPYPVSGSITRVVTGSGVVIKGDSTRTVVIARTVGVTFNGTEFVPMTVGNETYTLDLATGKATKN